MHSAILETGNDWNPSKGGDNPPAQGRIDPDHSSFLNLCRIYIISANKNQTKSNPALGRSEAQTAPERVGGPNIELSILSVQQIQMKSWVEKHNTYQGVSIFGHPAPFIG